MNALARTRRGPTSSADADRAPPRRGRPRFRRTPAVPYSPGRSAAWTLGSTAGRSRDATLAGYLAELHGQGRTPAKRVHGGGRGVLLSPPRRRAEPGRRTNGPRPRRLPADRRRSGAAARHAAVRGRPTRSPSSAAAPRRVRNDHLVDDEPHRSSTYVGAVNSSPIIRPKAGPGAHPAPAVREAGVPERGGVGVRSASGDDDPYGGHLRHVFQLLERQNLHGAAGRLGLHVHRLTRPERIRHVLEEGGPTSPPAPPRPRIAGSGRSTAG